MKLNAETIEVEASGFTSTGFSLEVDDPQIIEILTQKIYTDPHVFPRELMANAIDSGGIYELVVPDSLLPQWEVEDKGAGMSHDFMMTNYTKIFHSTKRKDNNNIGGFGHGRLSPLAYTDSYSVRSRFKADDGTVMEGNYVVYRGPNKIPTITCVSVARSEVLETGVRVVVPVAQQDISILATKTMFFAQYLTPTPPGVKPVNYLFKTPNGGVRSLEDRSSYYRNQSNEHIEGIRLIIGGVPYPCPASVSGSNVYQVDLFFNIGDLEVTLSRDAINNTSAAQTLINNKFKELCKEYAADVQAKVDKEAALFEKFSVYNQLSETAGSHFRNAFFPKNSISSELPIKDLMDVAKKDFAIHVLKSETDRSQWAGMDTVTKTYKSLSALRIFMLNDRSDYERRNGRATTKNLDFRTIPSSWKNGAKLDSLIVFAVPMPYTTGQIKKIKDTIASELGKLRTKNAKTLGEDFIYNVMLIQYEDKQDVEAMVAKIHSKLPVHYVNVNASTSALTKYISTLTSSQVKPGLQKKAFTSNALKTMDDVVYLVRDNDPAKLISDRDAQYIYDAVKGVFKGFSAGKINFLMVNKSDVQYLSPKAQDFKSYFIKVVADEYGYEYKPDTFKNNKNLEGEIRSQEAYTLFSCAVKAGHDSVKEPKHATLADFLVTKGVGTQKFRASLTEIATIRKKELATRYGSGANSDPLYSYKRMQDVILSIASKNGYALLDEKELPKPTKTSTGPAALVTKTADMAKLMADKPLLGYVARDYESRNYGVPYAVAESVAAYLK